MQTGRYAWIGHVKAALMLSNPLQHPNLIRWQVELQLASEMRSPTIAP
jgi:hypothetical protein